MILHKQSMELSDFIEIFLDISKIDTYFAFQFNAKSVQYWITHNARQKITKIIL